MRKLALTISLGSIGLFALAVSIDLSPSGFAQPPASIPDGVEIDPVSAAAAAGTGLNYTTGFEPGEGFPLGYISNAGGTHPLGCGGPAFPCWGHTTAANASLITPTVENLNPASGVQHLRLTHDPTTRTNIPNFGLGVDARFPRSADLSPRPVAPNTVSVDIAISNPGGMNFRIQPQSNSQGLPSTYTFFEGDGSIWVLDDLCGTTPLEYTYTGAYWDTSGAYQNFTVALNPCSTSEGGNSVKYYYADALIFSGCVYAGSNLEQFLVLGDNFPGSHIDVDNVVMTSEDACPTLCGNGITEWWVEECDGSDDSDCPGRCIPPGEAGECTCMPICTLEDPCPVENGVNGPYVSSSGYYVYSGASPFISVNGCGNSYDAAIQVQTVADPNTPIAFNDDCNTGPYGSGADPSASCFGGASGNQYGSCTCFANPNEPVLIWAPRFTGAAPILGSISVIEIRKKSECAGDSVGACCDTNGADQGCTDNVFEADCSGADKVWTDQGKCEEVLCECIPDCQGATCGDDGCGGSCGSCDDGNACNGLESCNVNRTCDAGVPLSCSDGNACNGVETCNPASGCSPGTPLNCNDGDFCNGLETCVPPTGCFAGTPPCADDETCDEESDQCFPNTIPAVGEWGLVVLALILLVAAKIRFARSPAA